MLWRRRWLYTSVFPTSLPWLQLPPRTLVPCAPSNRSRCRSAPGVGNTATVRRALLRVQTLGTCADRIGPGVFVFCSFVKLVFQHYSEKDHERSELERSAASPRGQLCVTRVFFFRGIVSSVYCTFSSAIAASGDYQPWKKSLMTFVTE
jgi:hypothetical protein